MKYAKVLVLMCFCVSTAYGQDKEQPSPMFNSGISLPQTPTGFSDFWKLGPGIGAGIDIHIKDYYFYNFSIDWSRFSPDERALLEERELDTIIHTVEGFVRSSWTVTANFKLKVGRQDFARPYVFGGLGGYMFTTSDLRIQAGEFFEAEEDDKTDLGFVLNGGAGVEVPVGPNVAFYLEGRYFALFGDENRGYIPIKLGLKFRSGN